jgi:hypothetical protein
MVELLCMVTEVHRLHVVCFLFGSPNVSLQTADNLEKVCQPQQHLQAKNDTADQKVSLLAHKQCMVFKSRK